MKRGIGENSTSLIFLLLLLYLTDKVQGAGDPVPCVGGKIFKCTVNPCQIVSNTKVPNAVCRPDYCDGCNARFFLGNVDVTSKCGKGMPAVNCPPDKPMYMCLLDPCQVTFCPKYHNARCRADYCGGCKARFYNGKKEVTEECKGNDGCPPGKPKVNCLVAPCQNAKCPAYPNAKCVDDYCGGCNARWFNGKTEVTDNCSTDSHGCPKDKPEVNCLVAPCQFAQCPKHPGAKCGDDYCGGCNARWYIGKKEVTTDCSGGNDGCPPGKPEVNCLVAPCQNAKCPAYPNAKCVDDYCGGCNARWFNGKTEVTDNCSTVKPKPKCRYAKYFKDIGKEPTCRRDVVSCPAEYRCNTGRRGSLGYCCLKRNPCTKGKPWKRNGEAVHCIGQGAKQCRNRYECIGSANSYSACCRMTVARKCPRKRPDKKCHINLCKVTYCHNRPGARCLMDTCGKCKAKWIRNKKDVTKKCNTGCPPGKEAVPCFVDPCTVSTCKAYPRAKCFSDYCGQCKARFFLNLREVTEKC